MLDLNFDSRTPLPRREQTVEISIVLAVLFPLLKIIFRALSVANRELVYPVVWHKTDDRNGDGVI